MVDLEEMAAQLQSLYNSIMNKTNNGITVYFKTN